MRHVNQGRIADANIAIGAAASWLPFRALFGDVDAVLRQMPSPTAVVLKFRALR